ncbi:MAG: ATP-dependent Clp protease proteolytic subunit [Limisphaerales bacterium]
MHRKRFNTKEITTSLSNMTPDPLVDQQARIMSVSVHTPAPIVIDRLLLLQTGDDAQKPITIFLSPDEDGRSIAVLDFLQVYAVMRALCSPIHTVALGMLRGLETLLLAAGKRGHRQILEHSMICVAPLEFYRPPFSESPIASGLQGTSLRQQAEQYLGAEIDTIVTDLRLDRNLFKTSQIFSGVQAIVHGIADTIVPIPPTRSGHAN